MNIFHSLALTIVMAGAFAGGSPVLAANNSVTDHTASAGISHGISGGGGGVNGKTAEAISDAGKLVGKAVMNKGIKEVFGPAVSGAVRAMTPSTANAPTLRPLNERPTRENTPRPMSPKP